MPLGLISGACSFDLSGAVDCYNRHMTMTELPGDIYICTLCSKRLHSKKSARKHVPDQHGVCKWIIDWLPGILSQAPTPPVPESSFERPLSPVSPPAAIPSAQPSKRARVLVESTPSSPTLEPADKRPRLEDETVNETLVQELVENALSPAQIAEIMEYGEEMPTAVQREREEARVSFNNIELTKLTSIQRARVGDVPNDRMEVDEVPAPPTSVRSRRASVEEVPDVDLPNRIVPPTTPSRGRRASVEEVPDIDLPTRNVPPAASATTPAGGEQARADISGNDRRKRVNWKDVPKLADGASPTFKDSSQLDRSDNSNKLAQSCLLVNRQFGMIICAFEGCNLALKPKDEFIHR